MKTMKHLLRAKAEQRKINWPFERFRRLVPYYKKQYVRKWQMKSLPLWYREHWGNLEIEEPTPLVHQRRTSPRQLHQSQFKKERGHI